ncbi:uncharacterized protein LOC107040962 [Diachasma alloeum]|uniref:uncharacterized protein LOC107040962 n=1 Tax=Diachasma alloeum TaxID=454923 RepID=UPI0007381569|nr:uncharacterized protein LOC107040962 [Diachasma alloeum]
MTDITKMFRQIRVHEDEWPLQQILWTNSSGEIVTYQLTTVTYGIRSAPFLANRVLLQLAEDGRYRFPLAVSPIVRGRYVDDICGGADTHDQLVRTAQEVRDLCVAGGTPLAKWHSNSPALLQWLAPDSASNVQRVYEDSDTRILGLSWQPSSDNFVYSRRTSDESKVSKRNILSEIAPIYDPLGVLSLVVIGGKLLMQGTWSRKLGWDKEAPGQVAQRWKMFRSDLGLLSKLSVPRWLGLLENSSIEIDGFSDASVLAMSAVVYLFNGAPLKRLTIPRLELTAAVILAKLVRWKEFVRNHVQLIQEISQAQWKLVPDKENPADCASHGLTTAQLSSHELWWHGLPWLMKSSSSWPSLELASVVSADLQEKPGVILNMKVQRPDIWDLLHRYSSFSKLLRVIARLRRIPGSSLATALNPGDIEQARLLWIKPTQSAHFSAELTTLSRGQHLSSSHPLTAFLTAFLDHRGVLRVGGRPKFAQLNCENKHQIIVSWDSQFAQLIIRGAHLRTLHGGTQLTFGQLRRSYRILGGRAPVRSFILKCVPCSRQRGIKAQQLMGQLPVSRLTPGCPFLNTGVDYAGRVGRAWS